MENSEKVTKKAPTKETKKEEKVNPVEKLQEDIDNYEKQIEQQKAILNQLFGAKATAEGTLKYLKDYDK